MSKIVDITEKLSFDENPFIAIRDKRYEVNADAKTVLEIMGTFQNKKQDEAMLFAYEKMFSEKDREAIESLKLPWKDFEVVIQTAVNLATGNEETEGE